MYVEEKLGELILKKGLLSRDQLREALLIQRVGDKEAGLKVGERIGRILLVKGLIEPMELVRVLCEQRRNIDYILVDKYLVEPGLVAVIPEMVAKEFGILPLVSFGEDEILVAANSSMSIQAKEGLEKRIEKKVDIIKVKEKDLSSIIELCYETFKRRGISSVRIGEILVRDGYLTQSELESALDESIKTQRMLGKILIERGKVNERDFFKILALQRKIPLVSAQDIMSLIDKDVINSLPRAFSLHNLILPYLRQNDKVFAVTAEPSINPEELKKALKCEELDLKLITYSDIETIMRSTFMERDIEIIDEEARTEGELEDIPIEEELTPVHIEDIASLTKRFQKITSNLLLEAIKKNASDIHIEVYENNVFIRFRIDGILYDIPYLQINKKTVAGIINVLKVWANLNIAERRLPQGGRFRKKTKDKGIYDFRIQTQPTLFGENAIIRVLSQSHPLLSLDELGFPPDIRVKYERVINNPSGLILITGPTGSGKTTTLYSTLGILRKDLRKKIVTIEDPIEYSLERIQQCQVKEEIGYNFARATRGFLREDPDVILIGEIRDYETAIEAMRASQTGHLVFSTLHTNNTIETIQRLVDIGIDRSTLASELVLILSQRLAKRICDNCKKPYRPSKELLNTFYPSGVPSGLTFFKGKGCELCDFRGHKGRIAVMEFWLIDMESKQLILSKAPSSAVLANAIRGGMVPMIKDALLKVESGIITLDELTSVIPYFEIAAWKDS